MSQEATINEPPSPPMSWKRKYSGLIALVSTIAIAVSGYFVWRWFAFEGHRKAAHAAVSRMDYDQAIVELAKAALWKSGDPELHLEMAAVYRHAGQTDDCMSQLEEAQRCGADPERVQREEVLMIAQGGYLARVDEEVRQIMESGINDDTEAARVYEALARGYLASYRIAEAQRCVDFWLTWQPEEPAARFLRADVRYRMGRLDDAISDYRFIVERLPEHVESQKLLGMLLSESGDLEGAKTQFQRVLELQPDSAEAKLELAYCVKQLADDDEAVRLAKEVIETGDSLRKAAAMELLSTVAVQRENYDEAVNWLEQALKLAPPSADLCHAMGTALNFAGQTDRAQLYMDEAQRFREMDERVDTLMADLVDQPASVELRFEMAELMFRQGMAETGANWLRTIMEIDPNHVPSLRLMADHLARVGKFEMADQYRRKADTLALQNPPATTEESPRTP